MRVWLFASVLSGLSLVGCGGDDGPGGRDAGGGGDDAGPEIDGGGGGEDAGGCDGDADCDDGVFCNGAETCVAGGCAAAAPVDCDDSIVCTADTCSETRRACEHLGPDADGDGHTDASCVGEGGAPLGDDCDDSDSLAFPGNTETCDGHDEDCNPETFGFLDADGDGAASAACCNGTTCGGDCDDADNTIRPGIADGPMMNCDNVDNDCDGMPDEGCPCVDGTSMECGTTAELMRIGVCRPGSLFCVMGRLSDTCVGAVHAEEERCDGIDNDCDGESDEFVERTYYRDGDADGFGRMSESTTDCSPPMGYVAVPTDCDDMDGGVNPGAPEVCDTRDNDCDGMTDEGLLVTYYRDIDGDGFGATAMTTTACSPPPGYVTTAGDCNDAMREINPSARDICDGVDNNCDGMMDVGCICTDGMTRMCGSTDAGECAFGMQRCTGGLWGECVGAVAPRTETCNGVDDDCDGMTDEMVTTTYYRDTDGDGFGATATTMAACTAPVGYVAGGMDCNDADAAVHPGALERCDAGMVDEDCDSMRNEMCVCVDGTTRSCGMSMTGACRMGTQQCVSGAWAPDCIGNVDPTTETCNGTDDDCDGMTDETLTAGCYADADADGYGTGVRLTLCRDAARAAFGFCPVGYTGTAGDCDDAAMAVRPMATEVCNGNDDDCDGMADETFMCPAGRIRTGTGTYGACTAPGSVMGVYTCRSDCSGEIFAPTLPAESCNNLDDDCDGARDETFACVQGSSNACITGCGTSGSYTCSSSCAAGACTAARETCNGCDDDGTGGADNGFACVQDATRACTVTCGGVTVSGSQRCLGDCSGYSACSGAEVCNGCDDDFDGARDETFACERGQVYSCTTACGSIGQQVCSGTCTLPACYATMEYCNYCDDDGDPDTVDASIATAVATDNFPCSDFRFVSGASCVVAAMESRIQLIAGTSSDVAAAWKDAAMTMDRVGWGPVSFRVTGRVSRAASAYPADGWAVILSQGGSGDTGGIGGGLGVPFGREGLAFEWRFYNGAVTTENDTLTVARVGGGMRYVLGTYVLTGSARDLGLRLDSTDGATTVYQTFYIEYHPDDPRTFANEEDLRVYLDPAESPIITLVPATGCSGGCVCDPPCLTAGLNNELTAGEPLAVGFTAATGGSNANMNIHIDNGIAFGGAPITQMVRSDVCF